MGSGTWAKHSASEPEHPQALAEDGQGSPVSLGIKRGSKYQGWEEVRSKERSKYQLHCHLVPLLLTFFREV